MISKSLLNESKGTECQLTYLARRECDQNKIMCVAVYGTRLGPGKNFLDFESSCLQTQRNFPVSHLTFAVGWRLGKLI